MSVTGSSDYSTPEGQARTKIDEQLKACGWVVQDYRNAAVAAAQGVAVREVPTESGPADYVLFVDSQAVGVIEAKKAMRRDPSESGTAARVQDPHWTDWHRFLSSFGIDSPSRTDGMQFALVSKCAPCF